MVEDEEAPLPPGYILQGSYRVETMLGRGGFGITYLATDLDLQRHVAIKEYMPLDMARRRDGERVEPSTLRTAGDYAHYLDSFRGEAKTLALLDHPNLVKVLRLLECNNSCYYVMEYLGGETLSAVRNRMNRTIPVPGMMLVLEKVLDGLHDVHRRNLLHRDIKPSNIMLAPLSSPADTRLAGLSEEVRTTFGRPVLIDFGAARAFRGSDDRSMTKFVTPGYTPPEQERGRKQDQRADIYALAATTFQLLTGSLFDSDDLPAGTRLADQLAGRAPPEFLGAIDQGLEHLPEHRPADVRAWRSMMFPQSYPSPDRTYADDRTRTEPQPSNSGATRSEPHTIEVRPRPGVDDPAVRSLRPQHVADPVSEAAPEIERSADPVPSGDERRRPGLALPLAGAAGVVAIVAGGAWLALRTPASTGVESQIAVSATSWTPVALAEHGVAAGRYTLASDNPFRVRAGSVVYSVTGEGPVDFSGVPAERIELKAIGEDGQVSVAPAQP